MAMLTNDTSERSLMIALRSSATCVALLLASGCAKDATFEEPLPEFASIHWVNAVPDTGQQDMRIVDIPENAGLFDANYRGANMFYQAIRSGTRTYRIFNSSTDPAISQQVLLEGTLDLAPDQAYTVIHAGFARSGQTPAHAALLLLDDSPVPAAAQLAVRAVNAGAGLGNVDVFIVRKAVNAATVDSLPDAPAATNIAFGQSSPYLAAAVDDTAAAAAQAMRVVFTAAGTKTVLASVTAPAGQFGTATAEPIAGSRIAGSVLSAVLIPRPVAGSAAQTGTADTLTSTVYLVDRRPPRGAAP
jgi:hypothetical protein